MSSICINPNFLLDQNSCRQADCLSGDQEGSCLLWNYNLFCKNLPLNYISRYLDKIPHYYALFLDDILHYYTPNYG